LWRQVADSRGFALTCSPPSNGFDYNVDSVHTYMMTAQTASLVGHAVKNLSSVLIFMRCVVQIKLRDQILELLVSWLSPVRGNDSYREREKMKVKSRKFMTEWRRPMTVLEHVLKSHSQKISIVLDT
jgi:hypothetical protein